MVMYLHLVAFMVNVGEYTKHMDPMGNYNLHVFLFVHLLN